MDSATPLYDFIPHPWGHSKPSWKVEQWHMIFLMGEKQSSTDRYERFKLTPESPMLHRVEKLNLRRRDSRAKLAGTTVCCAGAILMRFYRGPPVLGWLGAALESDFLHTKREYANHLEGFDIGGWKVGAVCLIGSCLCMALFINLQVLRASWDDLLPVQLLGCIFYYGLNLDHLQTRTQSCVELAVFCRHPYWRSIQHQFRWLLTLICLVRCSWVLQATFSSTILLPGL